MASWSSTLDALRRGGVSVAVGAVLAILGGVTMQAQSSSPQKGTSESSMIGKTVLITGSTDGLGREVARRTAALGAHVIVHGRNQERGAALVDEIARDGKGSAKFYAADFASLAEVRTLADAILRDYPRLDVLVNNAGVWLRNERQVSRDGYELHFAVNYLSGFLLTRMLLPRLLASTPSRIVNVASVAQSPIDFDDVMLERPGRAAQGYGQSKLAQILFTMDLAEELRATEVIAVALHPATLMDTSMVRTAGMPARSSVDDGADAVMHLMVGSDVRSGQYFNGLQPARADAQAYDIAARATLRQISLKLTGLDGR
jgi:NAD(P)-dependent dehydrogenase (short-subunit alcohol dehydrogenase family)